MVLLRFFDLKTDFVKMQRDHTVFLKKKIETVKKMGAT